MPAESHSAGPPPEGRVSTWTMADIAIASRAEARTMAERRRRDIGSIPLIEPTLRPPG